MDLEGAIDGRDELPGPILGVVEYLETRAALEHDSETAVIGMWREAVAETGIRARQVAVHRHHVHPIFHFRG